MIDKRITVHTFDGNDSIKYGFNLLNQVYRYVNVLKYIAQSHVLIDFNKIEQVGLTLRIMEGLFFNKKVLTNNHSIKNYSFYQSDRFFIYEGSSLLGIDDWIKTPMSEYNELDVLPYDINNWIRTFL